MAINIKSASRFLLSGVLEARPYEQPGSSKMICRGELEARHSREARKQTIHRMEARPYEQLGSSNKNRRGELEARHSREARKQTSRFDATLTFLRSLTGRNLSGQGTVELAVVLPIIVIVAVIAVNACCFFSECALFDREARQAVRVYATSYGYGSNSSEAVARISSALDEQFDANNEDVTVTVADAGDECLRYTAEIQYSPTLFSLGLKSSVFGVSLPVLRHKASLVVCPYNPAVSLG